LSFDQYLENSVKTSGTGAPNIYAESPIAPIGAAYLYQVRVHVYSRGDLQTFNPPGVPRKNTVYIIHYTNNHFNALIKKEQEEEEGQGEIIESYDEAVPLTTTLTQKQKQSMMANDDDVEGIIALKKLNKITPAQKEQLATIAADPKVMQYVANGKPWSGEKVSKLVGQAKSDWKEIKTAATAWMHWAIMLNDNVIGYFAIYPEKSQDQQDMYFLRYFIQDDLQKKGYGSQALRLALAQFRLLRPDAPFIYASVHDTNLGGKTFLDKHGFMKLGDETRKIGKITIQDYYSTLF
jgi:RimJ/RimL family protein N-acetyltransferase